MSREISPIVVREGNPFTSAPLRPPFEEWGIYSADIVNPPRRFWADVDWTVPTVEQGIDVKRLQPWPSPSQLLDSVAAGDNLQAQTRRSLGRLQAYFLLCEDPQRRMDARPVETLAHQVSLVRHVLDSGYLDRVLIADEVGLGKTVEVGLIIQELLAQRPGLRVLYLAPARLVGNVRREFDRLGLAFRQWSAIEADARLDDPRIIASIHRAVHGNNYDRVLQSGPWDVLVVDECHHLSAWSPGGGDPREAFRLVRDIIARQPEHGRVIFLSGTPHQGHPTRFENLLGLLRRGGEDAGALAGRVIYRTKDDILDWRGNPLFPPRQVNQPLVVDLGKRYREWIEHIHDFYMPEGGHPESAAVENRRRAAGWRCAQALQWAASSPQAGVGYLVRQAIRAGWSLKDDTLAKAIASLRPYRSGPVDEPVEQLFARISKEVARQQQNADVEDIEDEDVESGAPTVTDAGLADLLMEGMALLCSSGDAKWRTIKGEVLDRAGDEKVVLFAQPIETVTALARFLETETGEKPALIIGGQSDRERQEVVDRFRNPNGPRYLVSSRAGGEGINLQVAWRLVHIDVPWNPMEMEQRVGRVHRFGSRRTIIVDTIVVKDSREADAYRVAREKLELIASTLVERERFETVFSRVMCLVPPEELQQVLIREPGPQLDLEGQRELTRMVQAGFQRWKVFHERFGEEQKLIRQQDPGLVAWDDVIRFAREQTQAKMIDGFASQHFERTTEGVVPVEVPMPVLATSDGKHYVPSNESGAPVFGPSGQIPEKLGLNTPLVAEALRRLAFPGLPTGAAHLRWKPELEMPASIAGGPFAVLAFVRQSVRTDQSAGWTEHGISLKCFVIAPGMHPREVEGAEKGQLLRGLFSAIVRAKPEGGESLLNQLRQCESDLLLSLRRPTDREITRGIRHAAIPVFAATVAIGSSD